MAQNDDKTLTSGTTNRLAIFCFYDAQGHADDYVRVFLEGLMPSIRRLVVVSNGKIDDESRAMFEGFTPFVIERENEGLDTAAYRQVLLQVGWDQLVKFDEVICCNDTCFGPVHPFEDVFDEMNKRPVDFWGITSYAATVLPSGEEIPEHVQAYWHVYRPSLIAAPCFQRYWETLRLTNDYGENTHRHEITFTKYFQDLGFYWDTFVPRDKYAGMTPYPLLDMPIQVMRDDHCPVLKKRVFETGLVMSLEHTAGQGARQALDYVASSTNYDTSLIWHHELRSQNVTRLRQTLHLEYMLPRRALQDSGKKSRRDLTHVRSAFIFHIFFVDMLDETLRYVRNIPEETDIYITTNEEKIPRIDEAILDAGITRRVTFLPVKNRGRDVSALLIAARDVVLSGRYDVIGFAHDKKSSQNTKLLGRQGTESEGFQERLLENTLGSTEYVRNILSLFEKNACLGLVTPPSPFHAIYFPTTMPTDWGPNFENTVTLLESLDIHVPLDSTIGTTSAIGSCFWFRPEALRPLFERGWEYEDFPDESHMSGDGTISHAIERANGYVAQSQGFYPAWVMTDEWASLEASQLRTLLEEFIAARPQRYVEATPRETLLSQRLGTRLTYVDSKKVAGRLGSLMERIMSVLPGRMAESMKHAAGSANVRGRWAMHRLLDNFQRMARH